jgi:Tfp pilus assembly ATPase PilU
MAVMINHLNENDNRNIITIEDPVEYLHGNKGTYIARQDTVLEMPGRGWIFSVTTSPILFKVSACITEIMS